MLGDRDWGLESRVIRGFLGGKTNRKRKQFYGRYSTFLCRPPHHLLPGNSGRTGVVHAESTFVPQKKVCRTPIPTFEDDLKYRIMAGIASADTPISARKPVHTGTPQIIGVITCPGMREGGEIAHGRGRTTCSGRNTLPCDIPGLFCHRYIRGPGSKCLPHASTFPTTRAGPMNKEPPPLRKGEK